jgi:hypothetical protein
VNKNQNTSIFVFLISLLNERTHKLLGALNKLYLAVIQNGTFLSLEAKQKMGIFYGEQ